MNSMEVDKLADNVSNKENPPIICGDCGKGFDSELDCNVHMASHVPSTRIECLKCEIISTRRRIQHPCANAPYDY